MHHGQAQGSSKDRYLKVKCQGEDYNPVIDLLLPLNIFKVTTFYPGGFLRNPRKCKSGFSVKITPKVLLLYHFLGAFFDAVTTFFVPICSFLVRREQMGIIMSVYDHFFK